MNPLDFAKTADAFATEHVELLIHASELRQKNAELLEALQRLAHPAADDTDVEHALDVIARATGATVTPLNSPQARALEAWILENDLRNQRGPLGDAIMSAWLAEADSGQGVVEIPARWSVTGAPVTFNVWEAA